MAAQTAHCLWFKSLLGWDIFLCSDHLVCGDCDSLLYRPWPPCRSLVVKISGPIHSNGDKKFNKTIKPAILFYNSTKITKAPKLCIFCCIPSYIATSSMMSSQKVITSPAFNYWSTTGN